MRFWRLLIAAGLSVAVFSLVACDNTISPRADNAENVVAIYGYLDAWQYPQIVKISPLRATVLAESPSLEGMTVQSRKLGTSETFQWSDTTLAEGKSTGGKFFAAAFYPSNGETYVLEVLRNELVIAVARTTVPAAPAFEVGYPQGDTTNLSQTIRIRDVRRAPEQVSINYYVSRPSDGAGFAFQKNYVPPGRLSAIAGGWAFDVFLKRDLSSIATQLGVAEDDPPAGFQNIDMMVRLQSDEYDRPSNPVNLDNAHGFFGSYGTYEFTWTLDSASVAILGYEDLQSVGTGKPTRSSGRLDNQFEPF